MELAKKAYEAFARGDIAGVLEIFSPGIEWVQQQGNVRFGGTHKGPQAIVAEVFMVIPTIMEDFRSITQEFLEAGNRVFVLGEYHWKASTTGKEVACPYINLLTFENEKVVRFEEYTDSAIVNAAAAEIYQLT
jgi:ketosteroid isomerase-like protein